MYFAAFHTPSPLAHLQRALDELARAGFELTALHLAPGDAGGMAQVRIDYCGAATVSAETYLHRIRRLSDIRNLQGGSACAAEGGL